MAEQFSKDEDAVSRLMRVLQATPAANQRELAYEALTTEIEALRSELDEENYLGLQKA